MEPIDSQTQAATADLATRIQSNLSGVASPAASSIDSGSLIRAEQAELLAERQSLVLSIMAELVGAADLERALDAFAGTLQQRFDTDRVAISLVDDNNALVLCAISQQASIDASSAESRLLLEVSQECLEHERSLSFPIVDKKIGVLVSHRELASKTNDTALLSIPMFNDSEPTGVLLFERHGKRPFDADTVELLEHISLLAAPALQMRQAAERSLPRAAKHAVGRAMCKRFGVGRDGARFVLAACCLTLVLAALIPLPHRVAADAELVPLDRRLITAPFDGFIKEVNVVPGESIEEGQVLAKLERRELDLEGTRRNGEIASAEAEYRAAMASYDRQATAIARARLERERASRALVDQRLGRIELKAPTAGLIVNSNVIDAIGAPVTRGESIFEIAKADNYEVHLLVHERDIRDVLEGQDGTLRLRARPGDELSIQVHAIHPVAENIDGASRFRVRAMLVVPAGVAPRPGESGVARLNAGTTNLIKLWGRPMTQRLAELWWRLSV